MCFQGWAAFLHGSTFLSLLTSLPVVSQHCGTDLWPVPCWLCLLTAVLCTTLFNLDLYLVCTLTNGVSLPLSFFLSLTSSLCSTTLSLARLRDHFVKPKWYFKCTSALLFLTYFLLHAIFFGNLHESGFIFPPLLPFLISLNQSIFMFPLSFSSSSSLSSTPPSLDMISELDHDLSDISEDDNLVADAPASHAQWSFPSDTPTCFSDQLLADLEHLLKDPHTFLPIAGSQTNTFNVLGLEEGCQAKTRASAGVPNWLSWFSLRALKCFSLFLCFLSLLGKNCYKCLTPKLQAGVMTMSLFTATVSKITSGHRSAGHLKIIISKSSKLITSHEFHWILNYLALKWTHLVAFFRSHVPPKGSTSVPAGLWKQTRINWTCSIISSLSSLPTKVFSVTFSSSPLTLCPLSPSYLLAPIHHYLQNPSPLLLPCLLILFLLVVMLTASQSLVLALILATPLGLTLCYLENVVSSQRRSTVLPVFVGETPNERQDDRLSSGFSAKTFPQKLKHSPPHIRLQVHKSTNWTQEMCDPAAWAPNTQFKPWPPLCPRLLFKPFCFSTCTLPSHSCFTQCFIKLSPLHFNQNRIYEIKELMTHL